MLIGQGNCSSAQVDRGQAKGPEEVDALTGGKAASAVGLWHNCAVICTIKAEQNDDMKGSLTTRRLPSPGLRTVRLNVAGTGAAVTALRLAEK
jgi:hypothetical protein